MAARATLKDFGIAATLVVNLAVVVGAAVSVTSKLDTIANRSQSNCVLLRSAIILGIEQSLNQRGRVPTLDERQTAARLEQTFTAVTCA